MACNIQGLSHWPLWRVSDLGVYVLRSQPKGGLESLLCKETFVVVACGRVVQDRADFSSSWKTFLSARAVHLFITRRSTSTELSIGAVKLPVPFSGEFHSQCPTIPCVETALFLACCFCARNWTEVATGCENWTSRPGHVSGFSLSSAALHVSWHDYLTVVSQKAGLLLVALLINSSSFANVSAPWG